MSIDRKILAQSCGDGVAIAIHMDVKLLFLGDRRDKLSNKIFMIT